MDRTRILIIGGGYSGALAARRAALKTRGLPVEITLVSEADRFAERVRFHQVATGQPMAKLSMRDMLAGREVRYVQGRVTGIDLTRREVSIAAGERRQQIGYDRLIYALGSFVDTSRVPGAAENTLAVTSFDAAERLGGRIGEAARAGGRVVVCGGGLTGIELASEVAETYPGLDVSLVVRGSFGGALSKQGQAYLRQVFERLDIDVLDNTTITQVRPGEIDYPGGSLKFDLCLWAGGFGVQKLAREAGLAVNAVGQILVDDHLRSVSHPDVYGAGDSASVSDAIHTPIRMAGATALGMGAYAADDIAAGLRGKAHEPFEFAYTARCISLGRKDALVQVVDADDRPQEMIFTGQAAAWFKELLCRFGLWQVRNDQLMFYQKRQFWQKHSEETNLTMTAQSR